MINYAQKANKFHNQFERQKKRVWDKLVSRRNLLKERYGATLPNYSGQIFDDAILIKLLLTYRYYSKIQNRSIKTLTITLSSSDFIDRSYVHREEIIYQVLEHFKKHGITSKLSKSGGSYLIKLTTNLED